MEQDVTAPVMESLSNRRANSGSGTGNQGSFYPVRVCFNVGHHHIIPHAPRDPARSSG